jgi:BirA family biotin operon repressor/biotin-[acetyl-CoA-carboxylase] ligase
LPSSQFSQPIGQSFIHLKSVSSTNNYALGKLQEKLAAHGTVFFADEQTAGKGQRGKQWHTQTGTNIILSAIFDTSFLLIHHQFSFSAMVAVAVHDFFSKQATAEETSIKWPNDLYWRDRKAGGILIENTIRTNHQSAVGNWPWAVVGIGININQTQFPSDLTNAVSLKQITGKDFDVIVLAKELCSCLETRYQQLKSGNGKELLALYNQLLYKKGQTVRLKKENVAFNCTINSVNELGELQVNGAMQNSFSFGEVEWIVE